MFNQNSINEVNNANFTSNFKKPLYDSYCFSNIPGTILQLFGDKTVNSLPQDVFLKQKNYDQVVLFIFDGFGYNLFEKYYKQSSFLQKVVDEGMVSKLTTQFPSTTTANITTIHSGKPVGISGVYEWFYYEPKIDDVYSPLLYKLARHTNEETYLDVDPTLILPTSNIYTKLKERNVHSYVFQYELYNKNPYSKLTSNNSTVVDFTSLENGLTKLKDVLDKKEKAYTYFYHSEIDSVCHEFGPDSKEAEVEILRTLKYLDEFFEGAKKENVLFLLTADHGQTTMNKSNSVYINQEIKEIIPYIKTSEKGQLIVPCGSFRDMFLHIVDGKVHEAYEILHKKLTGKAEVYYVEDLINKGFFGSVTDEFKKKVGDLVILSYKDYGVWWYEEDMFNIKHNGMHGGLTKEELEIPFLVYSL